MPIVVSGMKTAVIDVSSDESEPGRMWPRAVEMAAAPSIRIDGNSLTMDFNCQIGKENQIGEESRLLAPTNQRAFISVTRASETPSVRVRATSKKKNDVH